MGNNISYQTAEYGKFLQLGANTAFPPISVVRYSYPDNSSAFPENSAVKPLSSVDVYPKYAVLTHLTNADDIKISLSAENINVSLDDLEDLTRIQNGIGFLQSFQLSAITNYVDDLEKNTFDTASACDDIYYAILNGVNAHITNTVGISTAQTIPVTYADSSNLDAFGRLRVSEPYTLLDSKNIYSKNIFLFDEVLSGTATANFSAYDSCVDLKTNANGDYVIRQTRMRFNYQPGKSTIAMFTGVFKPEENIIKRVGLFQSLTAAPYEPSDGIFMEVLSSGPVFKVVKNQGTPHTHYAPQSAWNVDKFDGSGPSGYNLDFTKAVLFVIDYEWLSIGRIRFGFYINGKLCYAHYNGHMGELTGPYMTFSNQPVRYEIRQIGAGSGLLRQICSTVMIEGGQENIGREYNIDDGIVTAQDGVYTPILALKLNPTTSNIVNIIRQIDLVNTGNKAAHYVLFCNPLITGGSLSFSPISNNVTMLSAAGNGSLTVTEGISGYRLAGGFCGVGQVGQSAPAGSQEIASNFARFGTGIKGDSDNLVLAAKGLGGTTTLYASINLIEKG